MQFDGLYKGRKPLQIGDEGLRKEHRNWEAPPCIKDLKLFMNIGSSAKPEVVLFPDLVPFLQFTQPYFH